VGDSFNSYRRQGRHRSNVQAKRGGVGRETKERGTPSEGVGCDSGVLPTKKRRRFSSERIRMFRDRIVVKIDAVRRKEALAGGEVKWWLGRPLSKIKKLPNDIVWSTRKIAELLKR